MRVVLVQCDLQWERPTENRTAISRMLTKLSPDTDLVVLPEMFTTGFSMRSAELAEHDDGPTLHWMKEQAASLNAAVFGSVIVEENGRTYNRGYFVKPDGDVARYDKRHLFRMANEHAHYSAGGSRVVVEFRGWRVLLQICYDLRFPVFSRNRNDYDLALYVANWPAARRDPWRKLLMARAIENQCYVIGVDRIGTDGNGVEYSGDSLAVDPKGDVIVDGSGGAQELLHAELDLDALNAFREKFPVGMDADEFSLGTVTRQDV